MTGIRLKRARRNVGGAAPRRGVVLVLVIFFIVLASSLAVLVMASSVQLMRTTRHEHESILLRQVTDSAQAWVRAQGGLRADAPVTLSADDILPESVSGGVEISMDRELPNVVVIKAHMSVLGREVSRTTRFTPSS